MKREFPITPFLPDITDSVARHWATVVIGGTGCGKTTQIGPALLEDGHNVVVTQPRIIACRENSRWVAEQMGEQLGGKIIGYRTAYERMCDPEFTRLLFATDGLQLIRELIGLGQHDVLWLDELHEWNLNLEVLFAWARLQHRHGSPVKLLLSSATLDKARLPEYLGDVNIVEVPGRLFPIEDRPCGESESEDVANLLREGRNVLWFKPGKGEIAAAIASLQRLEVDAEMLPLHAEMERADQAQALAHHERPKCVIATNIAETSLTIDDIDAVVDSGLEKRIEVVGGVETLVARAVALARREQRRGRGGRTKPGVFIDWCPAPLAEREEYPKPEIERVLLDQATLRLAVQGFDLEELDCFHQPPKEQIHEAKRTLLLLGCMDETGAVTRIGERVSREPVSVPSARMLVEAGPLGVFGDVAKIVAVYEENGIIARRVTRNAGTPEEEIVNGHEIARKRFFPDETDSDLLAQLAVVNAAAGMSKAEARESGVFLKAYFKALERHRKIVESARGRVRNLGSTGDRTAIMKAITAGLVHRLWKVSGGALKNAAGDYRDLAFESVLRYTRGLEWIVGEPINLEGKRGRLVKLVPIATRVDPAWLVEVAPQLLEVRRGQKLRYDAEHDAVVSTAEQWFTDHKIGEETIDESANPEAPRLFATWLATQYRHASSALTEVLEANGARNALADERNRRAGGTLFEVYSGEKLLEFYLERLAGATRVADIRDPNVLRVPSLDAELSARVERENPLEVVLLGGMQRVDYYNNPPRIPFPKEVADSGAWREIPDHVVLPSGREADIDVQTGWYGSDHVRGTGAAVKVELAFRERRKEAEALSEKLRRLREEYRVPYSREGWVDRLEAGVRSRLFDQQLSSYVPSDREQITRWMEQVEHLMVDVERSASGYEEREAALKGAEERGEILRDFVAYGHTRGVAGEGKGWVIRPDGSLREPEFDGEEDRTSVKKWHLVRSDEVALGWSKGSSSSPHYFTVHKMPLNGCTASQLATIGSLEDQLEREWEGARGLSSGAASPPVGDGWGIAGTPRAYRRGVSEEPKEVRPESWATSETRRRADEPGVDPDSPFAKLAALKEELEKKGKK